MQRSSYKAPAWRRHFLQTTIGAAAGLAVCSSGRSASSTSFSFLLLGDLHFDRLEHHDFHWLDKHHPGDLAQIQNYSKLTSSTMPTMFRVLKQAIDDLKQSDAPPAFVIQVGDLVEGLCGSEELAVRQNGEALAFIRQADLGLPFLFTKGNHDVTGDGAVAAFEHVLQPYMQSEATQVDTATKYSMANYTVTYNGSQFVFLDAYDKTSLEWFDEVCRERTSARMFVVVHPPVVPYGARATWHLYSDERSAAKRAKLLELLGANDAVVLGGHLHKFSALTRRVGHGRFTQLAVSSVVPSLDDNPRTVLTGVKDYTADQVLLEPKHSPETIDKRRLVYDVERADVTDFDYADTAGYAVVKVTTDSIEVAVFNGVSPMPFIAKTIN